MPCGDYSDAGLCFSIVTVCLTSTALADPLTNRPPSHDAIFISVQVRVRHVDTR